MANDNNRTVEAILSTDDLPKIITTINHNFQIITERIKTLNVSISYLDALKISTIFEALVPSGTSTNIAATQDENLRKFVANCWNTLANYAGVYIQSSGATSLVLFKWMNEFEVRNGDFIIKLPNNQSLYLAGAQPKYMVPSYDAASSTITYTPAKEDPEQDISIKLNLSNIPASGLTLQTTTCAANVPIPACRDCRFYIEDEEILFPTYVPGESFTIPTGSPTCTLYYLAPATNN